MTNNLIILNGKIVFCQRESYNTYNIYVGDKKGSQKVATFNKPLAYIEYYKNRIACLHDKNVKLYTNKFEYIKEWSLQYKCYNLAIDNKSIYVASLSNIYIYDFDGKLTGTIDLTKIKVLCNSFTVYNDKIFLVDGKTNFVILSPEGKIINKWTSKKKQSLLKIKIYEKKVFVFDSINSIFLIFTLTGDLLSYSSIKTTSNLSDFYAYKGLLFINHNEVIDSYKIS
jgi:hypothetical protein